MRKKVYSTKLIWATVDVVGNVADIRGTVSSLEVSRNKALVGSTEKTGETIPI